MISELDISLIHNFRKKINGYNGVIKHYFIDFKKNENDEGKDIWSKICSCMDWLTVAVEAIEKPRRHKNENYTSLEFTHFITTIDMIIEAIEHLWMAIKDATKTDRPYVEDRSVFNKKEFEKEFTDEDYFKEIRAWFGIHSVNGNEVKIEGFKQRVRFFSSWSTHSRWDEDGTYTLRLYSNNSEAEDKYGGIKKIKVDDILRFVALRYSTLSEFMNEIDKLYVKVIKDMQETPIELDESKSELNQLEQLYQQAKQRKLTGEHYEEEIQTYMSFLKCNLNEFQEAERTLVVNYLSELKPIITTYKDIIQNVDHGEFAVFDMLSLNSQLAKDYYYHFEKTFEYAEVDNMSGFKFISLQYLIKEGILPEYSCSLTGSCLSLLLHAIDFKHANNDVVS